MIRSRTAVIALGVIALGVFALGACGGEPEPAGDRFDGALADSLVRQQVAFGPRVPGTEAHDRALAWMVEYLAARADTVETIPFTHVTASGDTLEMANVFARFRPEEPARILLVAHWDSRPVAEMSPDSSARTQPVPGANDGASGVAVLLALADVFSREPPPVGVDILLTDGEDWGHDTVTLATDTTDMFIGARHFAATLGSTYRPLYGILLDIVGGQGARFLYEGHSLQNAPEVVGRVWRTAADLGYSDVFVQASGHYSTDDHVPLNRAGIRTIDIIDSSFISGPYWHTTEDTPDKISAETLDAVGEVVLEVIRREGSGG